MNETTARIVTEGATEVAWMPDLTPYPGHLLRRTRIVDELPTPSRWLNYKGDCRGSLGSYMGPNLLGEWFTVTAAIHDETHDRTRLGLAYGTYQVTEIIELPEATI